MGGVTPKSAGAVMWTPLPTISGLIKQLEKLAWRKQINGLSFEELGTEMGRDPEQLSDWLSGRHKPCRKNREDIENFLEDSEEKSDRVQPTRNA